MPQRPPVFRILPPRRASDFRPSAARRGYGHKWANYSRWYLQQPEHVWCKRCLAKKPACHTRAKCVDHIEPVTGPYDRGFWDDANHQPLCWSCHTTKTHTEDKGKGRARYPGKLGAHKRTAE